MLLRKKRGGPPLTKKVSKKKAKTVDFSDSELSESFVDEALKKMSCDDEVRMFSLVFDSSGLIPPMLTPLDNYFQNLMANISNGGVAKAILASSQQNVGADIVSDPVNLVSSPVTVTATVDGSQEEGEVLASQETARPSSQRFSVETPRDELENFGDEIETVILSRDANLCCEVLENILRVEQDATVGGEKGVSEVIVPGAKAQKIKGTTTLTLDFDKSDDEVYDEEAEYDHVSCLSESTINVITGERVSFQLEKGVSTGDFFYFVYFYFVCLLVILVVCFRRENFP
jgi:hypothetical protein